jgi:acetyltransferase
MKAAIDSQGEYPADAITRIALRDGTPVTIRPIRPEDAPMLQEGFKRLSPQSVYFRFLESFKELSEERARYFAQVDYQNRMALVAEVEEKERSILIGVARYALLGPGQPRIAEAAIIVMDEYQNRGLGSMLLKQLINYGRQHGVVNFLATVHISNRKIIRFVKRSGLTFEKKVMEPGVWEIRIQLDRELDPGFLRPNII